MIGHEEQKVYDLLESLDILYTRYEHVPVYTIEEANSLDINLPGAHCKNLFLRNRKGSKYYLVIVEETKKVDLKMLCEQVGTPNLSFASEERLYKTLGLTRGAVTPFGLINDSTGETEVLVDRDLKNHSMISFHPNVNTATITISYADFERFLDWRGNNVTYIEV